MQCRSPLSVLLYTQISLNICYRKIRYFWNIRRCFIWQNIKAKRYVSMLYHFELLHLPNNCMLKANRAGMAANLWEEMSNLSGLPDSSQQSGLITKRHQWELSNNIAIYCARIYTHVILYDVLCSTDHNNIPIPMCSYDLIFNKYNLYYYWYWENVAYILHTFWAITLILWCNHNKTLVW